MLQTIRVIIADANPELRQQLDWVLGTEVQLVAEVSTDEAVLAAIDELQPDILLFALDSPGLGGVRMIRRIKETYPNVEIIALNQAEAEHVDVAAQAIRAGVQGYLLRDASPIEVVKAIEEVARGGAIVHPATLHKLLDRLAGLLHYVDLPTPALTARQLQILQAVAQGMSHSEIAHQLGIRESTVRNHVYNIVKRLPVDNPKAAVAYARHLGLLNSA